MSLLLDALKEADGRHNRPAGTPASAPATGNARRAPAEEPHVLSILEENAPVVPAAPAAPQDSSRRPQAPSVQDRLARRRERRAPAAKGQGKTSRVALLALLVVAAGLGAAWLLLSRNADPPALVSRTLPLAPTSAPVAPLAAAPAQHESVISAPRLEAAAPAGPTPAPRRSAPVPRARQVQELPQEQVGQQAPVVQQSPVVVSRSTRSPLQEAYTALRAGDLKLAETRYREVLRDEPRQTDALLGLAALAQARGDTTTALRDYLAVLDAVPDHPRAWAGVADLAGTGEIAAMESRLHGLLASRPAAPLHFALGNLLAREARWPEAQESYFNAVTAAPANADYAFNLAVALDHLGKRGAAASYYGRALELARDGRPVQFDASSAGTRLATLQGAGS